MSVLRLMFAYKETVKNEDDHYHINYQNEDSECGCARGSFRIPRIDIKDRFM